MANGTEQVCECDFGFKGELCDTTDCPGEPDCTGSLQGFCIRSNNVSKCLCQPGFDGDDCSQYVCPGAVNETVDCNGNGK